MKIKRILKGIRVCTTVSVQLIKLKIYIEYENDMKEEKELSGITVFYSPDLNIHFTLRTIKSNPSERLPDSDNNTTIKFFPAELVGWEEGDMSNGVLIDKLEIEWEIEAEEEKREVQEKSLIQRNFQRDRSPMLQVRKVQVNRDLKINVILESKFRKLSTELLAKMNWLTSQQVKDILYEFHQIFNKTKKTRKLENLRRWKIKEEHVVCLQQFVNNKQITGFKLWDTNNLLLFNFPSLRSLSLTTVSKILKKQIGTSYKKLGELNPKKKTTSEHLSNLLLLLQTILRLFKLGCYVIFADEFLINRNMMSTYWWVKRGMPGGIKRNIQ